MKQCIFIAILLLATGTTPAQVPQTLEIGVLGETFVIGKTRIDDESFFRPKMYNHGQVPYQNWKDRKAPLPWNYNAEVIRNTNANIATDTGRHNQARFVPGYRTFISYSHSNHFGQYSHVELLFDNDILISFTADVDSGFYKTMTRHCGEPTTRTKKDTVACSLISASTARFTVTNSQYTWKKGNNKTEIIVSDYLDSKCIKRRKAVYQMTDMPKYAAYLKKVEEEQKRLEKKYTSQK